jgi:phosphoglucomutase
MNDYQRWLAEVQDRTLKAELLSMDEATKQDAFYKDLEFGTGGLRGLIGVGSNRLNIYTVAKISQGIANHVNSRNGKASIAVSYDSRINSTLFAEVAASVFAANGIKAFVFKELMPTPVLSFATRYCHCTMGVMITASHNSKEYNGYKVYNSDGCQITIDAADEIASCIEKLDIFKDIKKINYADGISSGAISLIKDDCFESYLAYISTKTIPQIKNRDLKIIYSPLNGTGLRSVTTALDRAGFKNVYVVPEQRDPDGTFRTCPKPNPELQEALQLGIRDLSSREADLLLVTDPDCDRCGTAVFHDKKIRLINGNEMGILMYDFLLKFKKTVPDSLVVKTIVSSDMIFPMAREHHMKVVEVLTGFKFIGEQIGFLAEKNQEDRFFMGFEESYGYLTGTAVRDKDAVDASVVIAQMFQFYKDKKIDVIDHLMALYRKYGYCRTALDNFEFKGEKGSQIMERIMGSFRQEAEHSLSSYSYVNDYLTSVRYEKSGMTKIELPSSDAMKFGFPDGSTITIRPSGTEPKLKVYYYIQTKNETELDSALKEKQDAIHKRITDLQR